MFSDVDAAADPDRAVAYLESTAESLAGVKRELLRRLRVASAERVLDLGCGAGHDLALLTERGAVVVGVDVSVRMIAASRSRCPGSDLIVGDGALLPIASGVFDACRIERVLQHVSDPLTVLKEAARVLRPDGRIVVFEPDWGSFAIDSHNAAAQTAITKALMLGVRHARVGLQLRYLLVEAGFTVDDLLVDVGRYRSIERAGRNIDLSNVCSRAVALGWLRPEDCTSWTDEMNERSTRGTFQGTFNRMIAVAHV
jgi:SAM-dependent methyltransferase